MSYNVDELFGFYKYGDGYIVSKYLEKVDPTITELEIPAEYHSEPVVGIWREAFARAKYLKIVKLPKCLKSISLYAFCDCPELERVELNSSPIIERYAFNDCPKLAPETVVMGLVGSTDITRPLPVLDFGALEGLASEFPADCFRPDVFELLAKNDCFREFRFNNKVHYKIIDHNMPKLLPIAERYGMLENPELVDALISYAVESQKPEITAYLLELKNRKFGFDGGNEFEL